MDGRLLFDLAVIAVAVLGWFAIHGVVWLATRPVMPAPAPATMELGNERPAVVSLLVNRWSVTEDAVESTLLDLAARGFFELRQPGDDPTHTTVHLPATRPDDSTLRPYEHRVLSRIRSLAIDGVLPLTALTFRDRAHARTWNKRMIAEVVADARAAGLSRRRFGPTVTSALTAAAMVVAVLVGYAAARSMGQGWHNFGYFVGVLTLVVLSTISSRSPGERDTPLGREVAARWLGVQSWLRAHEQFHELPPASVAIWDRYLGYGAAVGATHLTSAVLDLGMGDRTLVWSSYGGSWRRVRVHYPRFATRYGMTLPKLLFASGISIVVGAFLLRFFGPSFDLSPSSPYPRAATFTLVTSIVAVIALLLVFSGIWKVVRGLVDLATERTITGEVLWVQVWRKRSQGENQPSLPWLHYLAVDDGTADRTTAWGLPSEWAGRCHDGDTVTIRGRPWSRRVMSLSVVGHGRSRSLLEPVGRGASADGPPTPAESVFTPEEVGQALGLPVRAPERVALPASLTGVEFHAAGDGQPVLAVQTVAGTAAQWIWRVNARGQELPGIGGGAYLIGEGAVFRVGDRVVLVALRGPARARTAHLPWLLAQGALRASTTRGGATA
ncbi:DUF2207 family protein [Micromonospora tarapacensis]|uniref:DUF2207 family protein n=1 Tax=Micromonospora tarapacensis TaxID=2835305 RepID=UPI001E60000B|nr:DUF2207 domain-containing protein [Micromonospora tarapacensis]